jgi:hypothetical protein
LRKREYVMDDQDPVPTFAMCHLQARSMRMLMLGCQRKCNSLGVVETKWQDSRVVSDDDVPRGPGQSLLRTSGCTRCAQISYGKTLLTAVFCCSLIHK